jgi:hypothetical protein
MRRRGGLGANIAGVLAIVLVLAFGAVIVEGYFHPQGGSLGGLGNALSNGVSLVESGLQFAGGGGMSEVETQAVGLISDTFTGNAPIQPTCSPTPVNSFIQLTNTGSSKGAAVRVSITYAGARNTFSIAGPCEIGPAGSATGHMFILFKGPSELPNSPAPEAGQPFVGSVAMSDGADLPFTGVFSSGYHIVKATAVMLNASGFEAGPPTNATCSSTLVPGDSYVLLNNTGTVGAGVTGITIGSGNSTSTLEIGGNCAIGPDGTPSAITYILFAPKSRLGFTPSAAQDFGGTVALDDRTSVSFQGTFRG